MKRITAIFVALTACINLAAAQQTEIFARKGVAVNGYDVVAYFTESGPVTGNDSFTVEWKSVKWRFASKAHADLFIASPEKYTPQYGGYCAYGCSRGYKASSSPDAWTIDNGKLYLNYSIGVRDTWNNERKNYILKADANWPKVKDTNYP